MRLRGEDGRHEDQVRTDPLGHQRLARAVHGDRADADRAVHRPAVRAVGAPLVRDRRPAGQQQYVPLLSRQSPHPVKKQAPLARCEVIMPEYDPRAARQTTDRRGKIGDPRIGHQPDFGQRVAAAHRAAYSAAVSEAETRLATVRDAIAKASKRAGRDVDATILIAVSKTRDAAEIAPLIAAGQRDFGENRVQEAQAKWPALVGKFPDIRLHLVGQLQSNKAQDAVALFDMIHSVDRSSLIAALSRAQDATGRRPVCFLQVNIGNEVQKGGCGTVDVGRLLAEARSAGVCIAGLMAVPPARVEPAPYFALLAKLARDHGLDRLSMGMSDDFETAVTLGATHVRIGTALFGARG